MKSNLRAGLVNGGGGGHKRFPIASKPEKFGPAKFAQERQRKKILLTERPLLPAAINSLDDEDEVQADEDDLFAGPEVRPDGRMARVKADILAENQNKPESAAAAAAPSLEPFIEAFFASPSSPRPFVFTGSPRPGDQFGSASTFQPFFLPTAKSEVSPPTPSRQGAARAQEDEEAADEAADVSEEEEMDSETGTKMAHKNSEDDNENEIDATTTTTTTTREISQQVQQQRQRIAGGEEEETNIPRPRNQFSSRPSPASFSSIIPARQRPTAATTVSTTTTTHSSDSSAEESVMDDMMEKAVVTDKEEPSAPTGGRSTGSRQRQLVQPVRSALNRKSFSTAEEEECSDPFSCQHSSSSGAEAPTGHRPRVKSNITAKKRNFWQKDSAGEQAAEASRRKLRRGRKQKTPVTPELEESDNDISDEPLASNVKKQPEGAGLLDELMGGKKGADGLTTTRPLIISQEPASAQFAPTQRPGGHLEASTKSTSSAPFKDLFEEEEEEEDDDLIVSSSTVSAVVFKGSPTPSPFGFFSSPQPDWDGPSKNSLGGGGFAGSPRPSFTNIGNDIDLGQEKKPLRILPLDQLFFVSSTQSNKIVIGSDDEEDDEEEEELEKKEEDNESPVEEEELLTTTTTPMSTTVKISSVSTTAATLGEAAKRPSPFPSFPIRGKLLGGVGQPFPFRQSKVAIPKGSVADGEEKPTTEVITAKSAPVATTSLPEASSTILTEQSSSFATASTRFSSFNRGVRPNNLAFLNRKPAEFLSITTTANEVQVSVEQTSAASSSTLTTEHGSDKEEGGTDDEVTISLSTVSEDEGSVTAAPVLSSTLGGLPAAAAARFQLKTQAAVNSNFPSGFPNRSRNIHAGRKGVESATGTTAVPLERSTARTSTAPTTESPATTTEIKILSVESILMDDDSENELDSNDNIHTGDSNDAITNDDDTEDTDNTEDQEEEEEDDKHMDESQNFEKKLVSKEKTGVPSVKKALGPPPNANIRVEFKKATAGDAADDSISSGSEGTKKFFVKPDGRKPRVKSNIRSVK